MTTDAAVEQYKKKRSPEELDLIGEVRKVLNDNGLGNQVKEVFDNDPRIIEAKDKVPEVMVRFPSTVTAEEVMVPVAIVKLL